MVRDAGGAQSVERALGLLQALKDGQPELRVGELARLSGLGQSTVSRLLATLESLGYVERDDRSGLYRLGRELISLGGAALNQSALHREGRQIVQILACELGLGANLSERRGSALIYLANFEGSLAPRSYTLIGRRAPLHATGMGKALLCDLAPDELAALLPHEARPAYTTHTVTDLDRLHEELEVVRARGYATEIEELALGRACVAAPIRDRSGLVVAAISVSGPLSALDLGNREAQLARTLIERADQISVGLGYLASSAVLERS